jgi:RNA polymerase sigma factor (sigma-70 family)
MIASNAAQILPMTELRPDQLEQSWVQAAIAGDTQAFEKLYRQHLQRIHALCWRMCGGIESLAEEMTQEAFVRAWQKLGSFKMQSRFGTWMHRVAVNVVLSDRRVRIRTMQRETSLEVVKVEPSTDVDASSTSELRDLESAIAGLPERARTVLVLHDVEGYRHSDIAEITGMAVGSSKAQLHRARKLIRSKLGEKGS